MSAKATRLAEGTGHQWGNEYHTEEFATPVIEGEGEE